MNSILNKLLCCPTCYSVLIVNSKEIICSKNNHKYKLHKGIPVLIDYSTLPTHSKKQQIYFEKKMSKVTIESFKNMDAWKDQYLKRFSDNFKQVKNKSILEIGIGDGYMSYGLAKLGAQVIACDITFSNLVTLKKLARQLGVEQNLSFICCSADELPIKKNSIDYFVMNSVLEHVSQETKAIDEIKRVLKKEGGLMLTVPLRYKYIFPPLLPLNIFHDRRIGHLRRYDEVSLRNKLNGLQIKKVYFTGHPIKVIKVVINSIVRIFDEKKIEKEDAKSNQIKLWSSNLIAFFIRRS